ncbi:hypothetical protein ACFROC_19365 [Nocardia tengchongensis]|uniref:hypothetical protein n=1 Tax=Nocardia tengchongensis TaxID=2055889 RepID=UPI00369E969B
MAEDVYDFGEVEIVCMVVLSEVVRCERHHVIRALLKLGPSIWDQQMSGVDPAVSELVCDEDLAAIHREPIWAASRTDYLDRGLPAATSVPPAADDYVASLVDPVIQIVVPDFAVRVGEGCHRSLSSCSS